MLSWVISFAERNTHENGKAEQPVLLSKEEKEQLKSIAASRSLPYGLVNRARIVLDSAEGTPNYVIGKRLGVNIHTVTKWRQRYLQEGISSLHNELRPGRPRSISDEKIAGMIRKTLQTRPPNGTHLGAARLKPPSSLFLSLSGDRMWNS